MPKKIKSRARPMGHMSMRAHKADVTAFVKACKRVDCPQSEMFRRFVSAFAGAGKSTKSVTIRITGYSPR